MQFLGLPVFDSYPFIYYFFLATWRIFESEHPNSMGSEMLRTWFDEMVPCCARRKRERRNSTSNMEAGGSLGSVMVLMTPRAYAEIIVIHSNPMPPDTWEKLRDTLVTLVRWFQGATCVGHWSLATDCEEWGRRVVAKCVAVCSCEVVPYQVGLLWSENWMMGKFTGKPYI